MERWYGDNGKVIYWLTAYMVYGDMDCGVCKDEEDKKEPTVVSNSCYKPIKERGETIHVPFGKTYEARAYSLGEFTDKIVYQIAVLGLSKLYDF